MTGEQFERLELLFEQACQLPPKQRVAFARSASADDPEILSKLERLLTRDAETPNFLDSPALGDDFRADSLASLDTALRDDLQRDGKFHIDALVGEGGFGIVYRAEQQRPVRRQVAIKVIRPGMDTRRILSRFEAERQTLARLNHPGIAKLFDAGTTHAGRPYFVMEFIDGRSITEYCDAHRLNIRARIELFLSVCDAVAHAHQRGVIHRDLKPTNILVASGDSTTPASATSAPVVSDQAAQRGRPFVIDFGIARAVGDVAVGAATMTAPGQPIGTVEYMSPEQESGQSDDIDTRADVYSLGVVLYELLVGSTPLRGESTDTLAASTPEALRQRLRVGDIPTPTRRLLALKRASDAGKQKNRPSLEQVLSARAMGADALTRTIRGDLEAIVMKSLEFDRKRRYDTVNALADDLTRYLDGKSVAARPQTLAYRFQKFARRNAIALSIASLILVLLVAGVVGTTVGMLRSQRAEAAARVEAATAAAVNDFLNNDLLSMVAPDELGADVTMRQVLDAASRRMEGRFAEQPLVEAAVRLTVGRTLRKLGDVNAALPHVTRAVELHEAINGPNQLATLEAVHELAHVNTELGRDEEALRLFKRAYDGRAKQLGENHADTLASRYGVGVATGELGRLDESESLLRDTLGRCRAALGARHPQTLAVLRAVALLALETDRVDVALPLLQEAHTDLLETRGREDPATLLAAKDLASTYMQLHRFDDAAPLLLDAERISRSVRGPEHPATLLLQGSIGSLRAAQGKFDEAREIWERAWEIATRTLDEGHALRSMLTASLARLYDLAGDFDRAEQMLLADYEVVARIRGPSNFQTLQVIQGLIDHFRARGDQPSVDAWSKKLSHVEHNANAD